MTFRGPRRPSASARNMAMAEAERTYQHRETPVTTTSFLTKKADALGVMITFLDTARGELERGNNAALNPVVSMLPRIVALLRTTDPANKAALGLPTPVLPVGPIPPDLRAKMVKGLEILSDFMGTAASAYRKGVDASGTVLSLIPKLESLLTAPRGERAGRTRRGSVIALLRSRGLLADADSVPANSFTVTEPTRGHVTRFVLHGEEWIVSGQQQYRSADHDATARWVMSIVQVPAAPPATPTPAPTPTPAALPTKITLPLSGLVPVQATPQTPLLVSGYPYGRQRTDARFWIETNKKGESRFVKQTLNPKTSRWNKPKKSTYTAANALVQDTRDSKVYRIESYYGPGLSSIGAQDAAGNSFGSAESPSTDGRYYELAGFLGMDRNTVDKVVAARGKSKANLDARMAAVEATTKAREAATAAGTFTPGPIPVPEQIKKMRVKEKLHVDGPGGLDVATVTKTKGRPARWSLSCGKRDGIFIKSGSGYCSRWSIPTPEEVYRALLLYRATGDFPARGPIPDPPAPGTVTGPTYNNGTFRDALVAALPGSTGSGGVLMGPDQGAAVFNWRNRSYLVNGSMGTGFDVTTSARPGAPSDYLVTGSVDPVAAAQSLVTGQTHRLQGRALDDHDAYLPIARKQAAQEIVAHKRASVLDGIVYDIHPQAAALIYRTVLADYGEPVEPKAVSVRLRAALTKYPEVVTGSIDPVVSAQAMVAAPVGVPVVDPLTGAVVGSSKRKVVDPLTGAVVGSIPPGHTPAPKSLRGTAAGHELYGLNADGSKAVYATAQPVVDPLTGAVVGSIKWKDADGIAVPRNRLESMVRQRAGGEGRLYLGAASPPGRRVPRRKAAAKAHGHYAMHNGKLYGDTGLLRASKGLPGATLKHMGMGEFYLYGAFGRIDFHRRDSMTPSFPGFSGRAHEVTGTPVTALGVLTQWLPGEADLVEVAFAAAPEPPKPSPMALDLGRAREALEAAKKSIGRPDAAVTVDEDFTVVSEDGSILVESARGLSVSDLTARIDWSEVPYSDAMLAALKRRYDHLVKLVAKAHPDLTRLSDKDIRIGTSSFRLGYDPTTKDISVIDLTPAADGSSFRPLGTWSAKDSVGRTAFVDAITTRVGAATPTFRQEVPPLPTAVSTLAEPWKRPDADIAWAKSLGPDGDGLDRVLGELRHGISVDPALNLGWVQDQMKDAVTEIDTRMPAERSNWPELYDALRGLKGSLPETWITSWKLWGLGLAGNGALKEALLGAKRVLNGPRCRGEEADAAKALFATAFPALLNGLHYFWAPEAWAYEPLDYAEAPMDDIERAVFVIADPDTDGQSMPHVAAQLASALQAVADCGAGQQGLFTGETRSRAAKAPPSPKHRSTEHPWVEYSEPTTEPKTTAHPLAAAVGVPSKAELASSQADAAAALAALGTITTPPPPPAASLTKGRFWPGQTVYADGRTIVIREDMTARMPPTALVKEHYRTREGGNEWFLSHIPSRGHWRLKQPIDGREITFSDTPTTERPKGTTAPRVSRSHARVIETADF